MSETVVKVENLSKRYQLGTFGYGSLQHDMATHWARLWGRGDPNAKIGEVSRFDQHGEFWALKGVNFEVKQGERLGILGRNGAGKSTLLKILSRVTSPTEGRVKIRGRVASLLEVGTGFNPELTGRENIYLNGAIMGMKRFEVRQKFDEIVDFSGIPQFIDTPVKRYSSGMKVKLAFAVAAHLESEILIADEILAVGDAEFQRKSLGKMKSVSLDQGRTVLFVSHFIPMLEQLCETGMLLNNGSVVATGTIHEAIKTYRSTTTANGSRIADAVTKASTFVEVLSIEVNGSESQLVQLSVGDRVNVRVKILVRKPLKVSFEVHLKNPSEQTVGYFNPELHGRTAQMFEDGIQTIEGEFRVPMELIGGDYLFDIYLTQPGKEGYVDLPRCAQVAVKGQVYSDGRIVSNDRMQTVLILG